MSKLIYKEESYKIIGACFEVYKEKGSGFSEAVYHECLKLEFTLQKISFVSEPKLFLDYKGIELEKYYKPDFVCCDKIIIELKALSNLIDEHRGQTINYLKATKFNLALLINFGHYPKIEYECFGNQENYNNNIRKELDSWN